MFDRKHMQKIGRQVMARPVPEFKDDFVWENNLICMRAYGRGMEDETLSPGFEIWPKVPGRIVSDEWYSQMTGPVKVGKSLGGGSSMPVVRGRLQYPATNWRDSRIIKKKT